MLRAILPVLAVWPLVPAMLAADPQSYTLSNPDTDDGELNDALREVSLLISLRTKTPAPPFALIDRARGDAVRFQAVLESLGYYKGSVVMTIAGHDLADKTLPDVLDKIPQGDSVEVKTVVDHGPLYTLRQITFAGKVPAGFDASMFAGVSTGDPAVAGDVLAGQGRLAAALQERGYAFASVADPDAVADDGAHTLDIAYRITAGPHATISRIDFSGRSKVDEDFLRENLAIAPGDPYSTSAIETSRSRLLSLGVFSSVSVRPAETAPDFSTDEIATPVIFEVNERPRHAVALSGVYSTDLGTSLSASWSHRNLLGRGEQLNLSASSVGLGGTATAGIGYSLTAQFIKPRFLDDDQQLEVNAAAVKQHLDAYAQTAETVGVYLRKKFTPQWSASFGLSAMHDLVSQENVERTYQLLSAPLTGSYDGTGLGDPLADPVQGGRASLSVSPAVAIGKETVVFAVLQATATYYLNLSGDGRSVLAGRGVVGSIQGGSTFDLPPDQRLFAGGSGTVRGFRYQSIGPHFADGNPTGASSIAALSLEMRQRIMRDYGVVAFVDAGQASESPTPFNGSLQVGAGIGARYYTPIGAIRADVAVPVTRVPNGDRFEIYISIGQAF